jgi:hypothetical protein
MEFTQNNFFRNNNRNCTEILGITQRTQQQENINTMNIQENNFEDSRSRYVSRSGKLQKNKLEPYDYYYKKKEGYDLSVSPFLKFSIFKFSALSNEFNKIDEHIITPYGINLLNLGLIGSNKKLNNEKKINIGRSTVMSQK